MKKTFLIIFLIGFYIPNLKAQVAYYDAIKLREIFSQTLNLNSFKSASNILINYLPEKDKDTTLALLQLKFINNPFIPREYIEFVLPNADEVIAASSLQKGNFLNKIGNLDVTSIADGLAQFLIKRGKEELNIAFFQRMKDFLDSNVEARTLFPSTSAFLGSIAAYRYSELLQSLREAFYKDISNLIVNLNLLIDLPKYQQLLKALPEIRVAIRSVKIISELSQPDSSMHPANLISHFAALNEWGEMNINLESSWKVLDKISQSVIKMNAAEIITNEIRQTKLDSFVTKTTVLSDNISEIDSIKIPKGTTLKISSSQMQLTPSKDVAWIKFSEFNENILRDTLTLRIYLGLLYEKMEGISFRYETNKYISVQQFMKDNSDNIFRLADLIENFLVLANDVQQSINDIKNKKDQGLTNDDYYTYIEKAINVIDYGFKVANTIKEGIINDRYIVMARNANNLYKNIYTKNYNAAVMNVYLILEEVLSKSKEAINSKDSLFISPPANIPQATVTNFNVAKNTLTTSKFLDPNPTAKRSKLVEDILKYGNVMASIIKAENAEDAEAAIDAAVLPAGSSSIKKNTEWNISLNAYIGGYFGRSSNSTDQIDGNNSTVGVTAPVGIAFSKGLGHYNNGSPVGSLSLFATIIDVGAIAGYRLNDDSTALDQKVTLNEIFTPGGYLVYGIGLPFKGFAYIPLSVGYGWQYGSKLYYKSDNGKLAVSDKSRWRSNWFIAIDIPLANFWTRNYKKKG